MKILKIILAIFCLNAFAFAIDKSEIKPVMSDKVANAVSILKDSAISKENKPKQIFALFDSLFDYKTMAKLSLSKHYKNLSADQVAKFNEAYEAHLKQTFIDKLALYTNQDMKVIGTSEPNEKRVYLKTEIIGEDKNYPIDFKFFPNGSNWQIYDVDILGISLVQTYRSQFGDVDENISFDELLKRLSQTNLPEK
ncbi:MAG: ABC transporter substrate-binding protein [Campylobacter sp.]|nr:ABC transporter substrate-binding protein [Campylobacter sp.]